MAIAKEQLFHSAWKASVAPGILPTVPRSFLSESEEVGLSNRRFTRCTVQNSYPLTKP
jgi:hypothetical protein